MVGGSNPLAPTIFSLVSHIGFEDTFWPLLLIFLMREPWPHGTCFAMYNPWSHSLLAVFSLLYFLSPVDLVPDSSLVFGWIDDLAILAIAYYHWRAVNSGYFFADASESSSKARSYYSESDYSESKEDSSKRASKTRVTLPGDPYSVLGLQAPASQSEIKRAFKRLAIENHPDKFTCTNSKSKAHERMVNISKAYSRLKKVG